MKRRLLAGLAAALLVLGLGTVAAPAASASTGTLSVQGSRALQLKSSYGYYVWVQPGAFAHNYEWVVVPAGRCISIGVTSFTVKCANSKANLLVTIPNGFSVAKAQW